MNKWVLHRCEDEFIRRRENHKQYLPMEAMGLSLSSAELLTLVGRISSGVSKLSEAASFHNSNEGSMDSKSQLHWSLHVIFWFLEAVCLGCLNLCCGLWMESGNNSASVPSQLLGLTPSEVLQGWLLEPLCPSSRCIGMGHKTAMEDPYRGQEDRMTLLWECC